MEENYLITKGRVKLFLQHNGMRTANETYEAIDAKLKMILLDAVKRAEKNRRSTVLPWDL
ncbi:DUF1931 domain-containing protein [Candidatus Micrarchaeota archaeon]|nr:DUF1931 domain-containing protein [Candidatus Micrarchaeota archaeon]MBU1165502.1 DUF1931 domain-containing protein [Candidatus Micrarchaeota archaeon]MBU1886340.1 DUF1931 domain-containing protein [Candidatus Micrarchaeota archaeon]